MKINIYIQKYYWYINILIKGEKYINNPINSQMDNKSKLKITEEINKMDIVRIKVKNKKSKLKI